MQEIETYAARNQNTAAQYIATRPIMDLYLEVGRHPGSRVLKRWWYQESIDLECIREEEQVAGMERYYG